jgi:aspartyl-tRNA(Asn)/glutamyl-tRNA(Gln) amidotransferase subunit A
MAKLPQGFRSLGAAELGRAIGEGRACPVELTEGFLAAIEAHPAGRRIYAATTRLRACDEAMAARGRAKLGLRRGPLDGVPISWKDLFDSAGTRTEAGSRLLAGRVPPRDAAVLETATLGGLVCLGKTHMSELAFSGLGLNPMAETPPNVNDPDAVPGGSSSGAAASVAFGLAAAAIGSDTGGSVRVPAAWNDLVGFKPTHGLLPLAGVVPLAARFDTVGPLAHSVADAAAVFDALTGRPATDLAGARLAGARLMLLETVALDDLRDAPRQGFEQAVARLEAGGARIARGAVPELAEAMALSGVLYTAEAYGLWRDTIEARPELMYDRIRERFQAGAQFSGPDYVAAWAALERARRAWTAATAGFDAVIAPTVPILPPPVARLVEDAEFYVAENLLTLRNTRIGNLMGLCAITLPTGVPSTGLMLMGAPGADARLLRLAAAAEQALAG